MLNEFVSFVKTCENKKEKQQKTLIDEPVYFACPVGDNLKKFINTNNSPLPNGNYSDHTTIAFSPSEKQDYIRFLGKKCTVQIGKEVGGRGEIHCDFVSAACENLGQR